jgi:hypothetical protein
MGCPQDRYGARLTMFFTARTIKGRTIAHFDSRGALAAEPFPEFADARVSFPKPTDLYVRIIYV